MPLGEARDTRSWLTAIVPPHWRGCIEEEVMPLLRSLTKMLEDHQGCQKETGELAAALDQSFEELALYRRMQQSLRTGTLSSCEMSEIMTGIREILGADIVFGHFPNAPHLNVTICSPGLAVRLDAEAFTRELVRIIFKIKSPEEGNYFIVNNSSNDPALAPMSARPFRLMASRAAHSDQTHGWLGVVSFDYYTFFKRNHLNMLQAAASQAALVGTNDYLLKGLEGLTTRVKVFKNELAGNVAGNHSSPDGGGLGPGQFLDEAFNNLSKSIEATKTLMMRSVQMATMGQMASVFAHEIKQPVCALDSLIQIAQLRQKDLAEKDDLEMMAKAVRRITQMVRRFESFSRPSDQEFKRLSLNIVAREVYHLVKPQLVFKKIDGEFQRTADLPAIRGNAQSLQQAVLNLVSNAIQALESNNGGPCELKIKTYRQGHQACLEVFDNGPGIARDLIDKVVEPYFTTKAADNGTGLGLAVVSDIVEQHKGRLDIESSPGKGSRFTIKIPMNPDTTQAIGPQKRQTDGINKQRFGGDFDRT
jgi:signal transduction histidine kinase